MGLAQFDLGMLEDEEEESDEEEHAEEEFDKEEDKNRLGSLYLQVHGFQLKVEIFG